MIRSKWGQNTFGTLKYLEEQDHSHGNVDCFGSDASEKAVGDSSREICVLVFMWHKS
jgi:hypothetical protein